MVAELHGGQPGEINQALMKIGATPSCAKTDREKHA
jgi:hypothetical protein